MSSITVAGSAALVVAVVLSVAAVLRDDDGIERRRIERDSIVVLGDSITEQGPWPTSFSRLPIANRGFAGFTTEQLVPVAVDVAARQPRVVVILTGTNDIRDGRPPPWTVRYLSRILDAFAESAPRTEVIVQTILPRADRRDEVVAANRALGALVAERDVTLLDLHDRFDDGTGALRESDTVDGLHLSDAGNHRWAEILTPVLAEL